MHISEKTNIHDLLKTYPYLEDFLAHRNVLYKNLKNPFMRNTVGRLASLAKVASMSGDDLGDLLDSLEKEIRLKGRNEVKAFIRKKYVDPDKKTCLKDIIVALHEGEDPEGVKKQFAALAKELSTVEMADLEQSLIDDGLPVREVRRLCDLHVAVFEQSVDAQTVPELVEGHPIHTYMQENRKAEKIVARLKDLLGECGNPPNVSRLQGIATQFDELLTDLGAITVHYARQEKQLFPLLENCGITGPTKIMRVTHDEIRDLFGKATEALSQGNLAELVVNAKEIIGQVAGIIYREEHILFPMALDVLSAETWQQERQVEDSVGYAWIDPPPPAKTFKSRPAAASSAAAAAAAGRLDLQIGAMTPEQIDLIFAHLPVDVSFVDENDRVVYYSANQDRVFPRRPADIGQTVQDSHPPDSVAAVNAILNSFRAGAKRSADFWITLDDRFIFIQYFAVFDKQETYRGCLEVVQDVTRIRQLSGERHLLDQE